MHLEGLATSWEVTSPIYQAPTDHMSEAQHNIFRFSVFNTFFNNPKRPSRLAPLRDKETEKERDLPNTTKPVNRRGEFGVRSLLPSTPSIQLPFKEGAALGMWYRFAEPSNLTKQQQEIRKWPKSWHQWCRSKGITSWIQLKHPTIEEQRKIRIR